MKKIMRNHLFRFVPFITLFTTVLIFPGQTERALITCKSISELEPYIATLTNQDLVIFDFDNTLFRPSCPDHIGGDEWARGCLSYFMNKENINIRQALDIFLPIYGRINDGITLAAVEGQDTINFLKKVQASGCRIMILTARTIIDQTFKQIKNIDFDFTKNALCNDDLRFNIASDKESCDYRKGFLFCGNNNKGHALFAFLKKINCAPQSVMFVDDRKENVIVVEQACCEHNVACKGIHYTYLQDELKNYVFDPQTLSAYTQKAIAA